MPIKIPDDLPATGILEQENVFVMKEGRAYSQDIRPLRILLLNLMPTKIVTETQLLRLLGNTPLQVEVDFLYTATYAPVNTAKEHLFKFYETFAEVKAKKYDGMIITGAPVEQIDFEQVAYWPELCEIMEWAKTHVFSTLYICWGAQAALYYHYGVPKHLLPQKMFGVFPHRLNPAQQEKLFRGFDDVFYVPQSRHTEIRREDITRHPDLVILSESAESGVYAVTDETRRNFYITGHLEYDPLTLKMEYDRDIAQGQPIHVPVNYYPGNDPSQPPVVIWRSAANLFFSNWLNYYVYQETPYNFTNGTNGHKDPKDQKNEEASA